VLKYARHKTGKNAKAVEDLLIELQNDKKRLEDQLQEMKDREVKLQRLIKNYELMSNDLNIKRKRLKLDTKQHELQKRQRDTQEIDKLIKELKHTKNVDAIKEVKEKEVTKKKELKEEVKALQREVYSGNTEGGKKIKEGDFVKLISGGAAGKVDSIQKNKAIVMMGIMKMTVDLDELIPANEPIPVNKKKSINTDNVAKSTATFETKIDIRGLYREEAIRTLEAFLDKAIINNVDICEIIHGKGNGVLKKSVLKKIREYKDIKEHFHPPQEAGGDGVTIVYF